MRRTALLLGIAVLALAQAPAPENRDAYRSAYQAWRTIDSSLEKDAALANPAFGARADKVAAQASKYLTEKKTYAEGRATAWTLVARGVQPLTIPQSTPEQEKNIDQYVSVQSTSVATTIGVFGNDPDRGIQQLRQTMERERAALQVLADGLKAERSAAAAARDASDKAEQSRMKFAKDSDAFASLLKEASDGTNGQISSWPAYYRTLSDAARAPAPSETPPPAEITIIHPAGPVDAAVPARVVPQVPLSRYVGGWTFMKPSSLFLGAEPEFVDLVVHEDKGVISGTLYARFKLPAGNSDDPVVRFDFTGALRPTRNQSFPSMTSDRAAGNIELIPGPAFNLLEVNFKADPAPGKIRQGNFILVKK